MTIIKKKNLKIIIRQKLLQSRRQCHMGQLKRIHSQAISVSLTLPLFLSENNKKNLDKSRGIEIEKNHHSLYTILE